MSILAVTESSVVVRSVGWALIESVTLVVLSFITLLVTARLLGPTNFGIAATVIAIIGFLNTAVEGLFSEALVQRATVEDGHVSAALLTALGVAVSLVVLCCGLAGPLGELYGEPQMAPLLRFASIGLLFSAYSGVQSAVLRRDFRFRQLALRTMFARVASCGMTLVLALEGYGSWSLIAQYLVSTILGALTLWYWAPRPIRWHRRHGSMSELWGFAGPWLANEIVQVNLPRLYQALAAYLFGAYQFGLLGMSFRVTDTMRDLIGNIANNVGLPIFARLQDDRHALARHYAAATSTQCIIALPCFAGVAICATTIVQAILGTEWLPSVPLIQMMAGGACVGFTASLSYTVFAALGRPALVLPLSVVETISSLALLLVISDLGIMAAGLAWAVRQVFSAFVLQVMCMRMLPLRSRDVVAALWRPILMVSTFSGLLLFADLWMPLDLEPVTRLVLLALVGGAIFAGGIAVLRPDLIRMILALRRLQPRPRAAMRRSAIM